MILRNRTTLGGVTEVLDTPPTRADWVDQLLRTAILHGDLAPGEKLVAERLAQQWGVSATPLRETFRRLAGEGLVVLEPQRGARVAPVSLHEAAHIYEVRLLLDPVAIEQSVRAGGAEFVAEVEASHRALTRRHASAAASHDAHRAFHLALVSRCPNRLLVDQVALLLEHSQRIQAALVTAGHRKGNAAAEHQQLTEAACAGDARGAAALLRSHLQATLAAVRAAGAV